MSEEIRIDETVELHDAVIVIGLDGWGNAGKVSTLTVKFLADKLRCYMLYFSYRS